MKEIILARVEDMVSGFLYYDRKEDGQLRIGAIEKAIKKGLITKQEIIDKFAEGINNIDENETYK